MPTPRQLTITIDGIPHTVRPGAKVEPAREIQLEGAEGTITEPVRVLASGASSLLLVGRRVLKLAVSADGSQRALSRAGTARTARVGSARELAASEPGAQRGGAIRAPMPGRIVEVAVEPGQRVEAGARVLVIEAMKMQNELFAPEAREVAAVLVRPGDAVERGAELVRFA